MKRGDIYFANLNPTIGSEIKKTRPVLIVSNNANNSFASTVTIVPITSNVKKVYPFEVFLSSKQTGLSKQSKAQCHQIRTISKLRIMGDVIGLVNFDLLRQVDSAIRLHLDLR
ncbi:MAG: type II toxin-antitoxin system PemK/MazF family toxin [Gammaproteobacteria bacterium]